MVNDSEQVTAHAEEIEYETLDREKPLRVPGGFEPAHLSLALSRWLVRDLRSIVHILVSVQWTTDGITLRQADG